MRIESDTTSHLGNQLTHSHTHHITKCLLDEEADKNRGAAAGIRKDSYQASEKAVSGEEPMLTGLGADTLRSRKKPGTGVGLFQEIWNAMGEEGENERGNILPVFDRNRSGRGIREMLMTVRQDISYYIVNKWEAVRDKIKIGTRSALKRFGKNQDGFTMSSDIGRQAAGNNSRRFWEKEEDKRGTRQNREEIPTAHQADNHLMDSYSKTGEYCKINENLTFQKK